MRAFIPILVFALLFPASSFGVPKCSQISASFCAPGECGWSEIQWQGDCNNHNIEWRCIWHQCPEGDVTSAWIPCACPDEQGGCDCMLKGTPITLADGSTKPVESIQKVDRVLGFDEATHSMRPVAVVATHAPFSADHYYVINGTIRLTEAHPVFTRDTWLVASDLKVGDLLVNAHGLAAPIFSIERVEEDAATYNFQVQGGTYVASGIVVHNKDDCENFMQYPEP